MRIAIVVQRYGNDIVGGAETHARLVAEHMKKYHDIEILTTCAKDYTTWRNEYKSGNDSVNGITVRRFKNKKERGKGHSKIEDNVFYNSHDINDEISWIDEQGPYCIDLIEYIKNNEDNYDCFIFFTFRYYPSYYGIKTVGYKSFIAPLAEDDPALNLTTTKDIFENVKGIIYNAPEERELIVKKVNFKEEDKIWDIVGCGIEISKNIEKSEELENNDYILYLGRIDGSKGCYKLFEHYMKAIAELGKIPNLILAGYKAIDIPKNNKIKYVGTVSEQEKLRLLKNAKLLIMPSQYESLSIVTLESLAIGTPVLVNGECDILKGHCIRSNAGLWYQNYDEFVECLRLLLSNENLREKMDKNGSIYVEDNYTWKIIEKKYLGMLDMMQS